MKEIIEWLEKNEEASARIYDKASVIYAEDLELARFLMQLRDDEKVHHTIMKKALKIAAKVENPRLIHLSDETKELIESCFNLFESRIEKKKLTMAQLIDSIISIEYTELNDLFMYVVNTLKMDFHDFIPMAVEIHRHKRHIESFIESLPDPGPYLEKARKLKPVWQEKVLVVDGTTTVAEALSAVLDDESLVEKATDIEEGLKMIDETYFAAIITDEDLPRMNGLDFYKKAVARYPRLREKFLLFIGENDSGKVPFLKENNLKYIVKPTDIRAIKKAVIEILGG